MTEYLICGELFVLACMGSRASFLNTAKNYPPWIPWVSLPSLVLMWPVGVAMLLYFLIKAEAK